MKSRFFNYRTWTAAILLMALVVPRCLMASNMIFMEETRQPPCHGMQETVASAEALDQLVCAQQCEQTATSSLSVKEYKLELPDYSLVALASNYFQVPLLTSTNLHQGWPPDNQFLLSSTPDLYLDTGRLRL